MHEDESTKSFEVHISEIDIIGVKSGVVLDFLKVQVAVEDEIDCIMRYEVVELAKFSDCKQGTCADGSWIENRKGDIVRYCIDAKQAAKHAEKQAAYDHGNEVRQTTIALLTFLLLFSIVISIFCDSDMIQSVTLFHALMGELALAEQGFEWYTCMKHGLEEGESEDMMSSGRQVSSRIIRDDKDYPNVLETDECADVAGILLYHDLDLTESQFVMGRLRPEVMKSKREYLYMLKHYLWYMIRRHCCARVYDFPERHCVVKLADAGWASDGEHRRYVDWMHIDHSGDLIELSTSIQQLMSLFTAENKVCGIVRGAASGIQFQKIVVQSGLLVRFWVLSDSSMTWSMTARIGSGQVEHLEVHIWVCDCFRKKQFSMESIEKLCNLVDLGTEFHTDESLGIWTELELTKPTEELLYRFTVYYCVLVLVYILGLISGVLMMVLVCFVVNYTFGARYAESPVNCVEAGTQVDLLACDEQLNRGVGSRLELPAVAAKACGIGESLHVLLGIWT